MAKRARVKQIIQVFAHPSPDDGPIGPFTTDENAWTMAETIAEKHVVGWLFHLRGTPVEGFRLATSVTVEGLAHRKPHPHGTYTWQVEGAALIQATGLTPPALDAFLADYRTMAGRVERMRSASADRARKICAAMEEGVHPRAAINAHKLPSVRRLDPPMPAPPDPTADVLTFYREAMVNGEVVA